MKKLLAIFIPLLILAAVISGVVISSVAFSEDPLNTFTDDSGLTISGYGIAKGKDYDIIDIYTNTYGEEAHNSLIILSAEEMTISGKSEGSERRIWIASPDGANLTFSDLTIKLFRGNPNIMNMPGTCQAAVGVADTVNGTVNITLEGTNELESGPKHAGLENNSVPLVIKGTGSLTASGYLGGAGIGGGNGKNGANITIESGIIYAEGSGGKYSYKYGDSSSPSIYSEVVGSGAGIGGGNGGDGVNITISNSTVTAKSTTTDNLGSTAYGHGGGAGIGGGNGGSGSGITINDSTVRATGVAGAGIGGGMDGDGVDITIKDSKIYAKTTSVNLSNHGGGAGIGGGCGGNGERIIISGGEVIAKNRVEYSEAYADDKYDFDKIEINTADFDINGYQIGNVSAGAVFVSPARGDGAGIGGGAVCGGKGGSGCDITICGSADVRANGGTDGAAIGGGKGGSGERITIKLNFDAIFDDEGNFVKFKDEASGSNGKIRVMAQEGAGIGGGNGGDGKNIDISGSGTITSYSSSGAGIGGGNSGNGDTIDISGSVTIMTYSGNGGAGIGGGTGGDGSNITIGKEGENGGVIYATGGSNGAGIGGGSGGNGDKITINSGEVHARSATSNKPEGSGAGIGGGATVSITSGPFNNPVYNISGGTGSNITINGGVIIAESGSGAGIGGGAAGNAGNDQNVPKYASGTGSDITITGGNITATSSFGGAGIGGGSNGDGSSITIGKTDENKTIIIHANGGKYSNEYISFGAAGIGGGCNGSGTDITITGGEVHANGEQGAAGIGGGMKQYVGGDATDITISGGEIHANGGESPPGAGIGGGYNGSAEGIKISGDADVIAEGKQGAAGIGGSYGNVKDIEISGEATVTATSQGGAGIGVGSGGSCKDITISGGKITANGTYSGTGISGSTVTIGDIENYSSYPLVYTNSIQSGNGDGDYYGIVFNEAHKGDYTEPVVEGKDDTVFAPDGVVYGGTGKTIVLDKEITLKESETLRVQAGTTFVIPGVEEGEDKLLTLEPGSTLYLEEKATLNTYENINNNGNIKHYDDSDYDASTGLCTICGSIGTHKFAEPSQEKSTWDFNVNCHWHRCEETKDCSIFEREVNTCNLLNVHNNEEYGHSAHILEEPTRDGNILTYACQTCYYSYKMEIPQITVNKTDNAATPQPLPGAKFGLYNNAGCADSDKIAETTSADDGKAVFDTVIDLGTTYYIKEIEAPTDYKKSDTKYTVTITAVAPTPDETTSYSGASEDPYVPVTINGTAAYSNADIDIGLGNELTVKNAKINTPEPVIIIKTDDKGAALAGAEFGIFSDAACTSSVAEPKTTAIVDGTATVSFDTELNTTYFIKETKAPNGYTASETVYKAVVGADGSVTYDDDDSVKIPVCINYAVEVNPNPSNPGEVNPDPGEVNPDPGGVNPDPGGVIPAPGEIISDPAKIIKADGEGNPLAGAEFGIYSDEECAVLITTKTTAIDTDNKAVVSFDTEPNKTYYIKEIKAPDGYTASDEVFKAVVGADGKVTYGAVGSETASSDIPVCKNERSAADTSVPADTPNGVNNPETGVVLGTAGFAILSGIICTVSSKRTQSRRKRKNGDNSKIDF